MQGLMHKSTQLLRATFCSCFSGTSYHGEKQKRLTSIDPDSSLLQDLVDGLQVVHNILGGIDEEACHHRIPFPYFKAKKKEKKKERPTKR